MDAPAAPAAHNLVIADRVPLAPPTLPAAPDPPREYAADGRERG